MSASHFIRQLVDDDLRSGRHTQVRTRFPPEPNGHLHIGHAKAICINFGIAAEFSGTTTLRMDDTNPTKEDTSYVDGIARDVAWLGFEWVALTHASDAFDTMYAWAEHLVEHGHAYVCHQTEDEMRATRGTVTVPGTASPWRDRPWAESLTELRAMRDGLRAEGSATLRARIDMAAHNMKLRDPPLYRIRKVDHHRTGDRWCIYPMYDYAHPISDALEGITHSLCTLEFDNNRALYDWVIEHCPVPCRPRQTEYARLNIGFTMMSKRRLLALVEEKHVTGWDDPRMPTLAGFRRRGVRPEAIRAFCERVGVARADNLVDADLLEATIRDDLEPIAPRYLAVVDPVVLEVTNWPDADRPSFSAPLWPDKPEPRRDVPFGRRLLVERSDVRATPEVGFHRLSPRAVVRLRHAFVVTCDAVETDADGRITRVLCTADLASRGAPVKAKGTVHWVAEHAAVAMRARLVERLFTVERPDLEEDFRSVLRPLSLGETTVMGEPALAALPAGSHAQFERVGFFVADAVDSTPGAPVFNRVVALRDNSRPAAAAAERTPATTTPAAPVAPPPPLPPVAAAWVANGATDGDARALAHDATTEARARALVAAGAPARAAAAAAVHVLADVPSPPPNATLVTWLARQADGTLSARAARAVLDHLVAKGGDVDDAIDALGLRQLRDPAAVMPFVADVLGAHPDRVSAYRGGKTGLFGFFVGQVIARSGGRADPAVVADLIKRQLDAS